MGGKILLRLVIAVLLFGIVLGAIHSRASQNNGVQ
jgi:hypothetical protein